MIRRLYATDDSTATAILRLTSSAVTVLSVADPVRVFQEFGTLDLIDSPE